MLPYTISEVVRLAEAEIAVFEARMREVTPAYQREDWVKLHGEGFEASSAWHLLRRGPPCRGRVLSPDDAWYRPSINRVVQTCQRRESAGPATLAVPNKCMAPPAAGTSS